MSNIKLLKQEADTLGVKYQVNISEAVLGGRVQEAKDILKKAMEFSAQVEEPDNTVKGNEESEIDRHARLRKSANRLIRVRVSCLDQRENARGGMQFQVSNSVIGNVGKFVEFGVPWHVPQAVLGIIEEKQFQHFVDGKAKNGITPKVPKMSRKFSIEYLEPLTAVEFKELQQRQAMSGNLED